MKRFTLISILFLVIAGAFYCAAENFLAAPIRKRTVGQLKQEVVEVLGVYLQQACKIIETSARLQMHVCSCIKQLAEGESQAHLSKASRAELQATLDKLYKLRANQDRQLAELSQAAEFVSSGCVAQATSHAHAQNT